MIEDIIRRLNTPCWGKSTLEIDDEHRRIVDLLKHLTSDMTDKNESNNRFRESISAVSEIDSKSGVSQSVYVIEECSELVKELMKKERGKANDDKIIDEACDVLTTVFVLLCQYGTPEATVREQILFKCNRALERFRDNGEV